MMLHRFVAATLALLLAGPALAQSPGNVALVGPSTVPGAAQLTPAAINAAVNAALAAKADATNGTIANPTFVGGAASSLSVTSGGTTNTLATWMSYLAGGSNPNAYNTASTYQINGNTELRVGPISSAYGLNNQVIFGGLGAGASYDFISNPDVFGAVGYGSNALGLWNGSGGENAAFGSQSCHSAITASLTTCIGMNALGADPNPVGDVALGNDARRDSISTGGYTVALGQHSMAHGNPNGAPVAIGSQTLRGNSAAIVIAGTKVAGTTINVTASSAYPGLVGFPINYTYTVTTSDVSASGFGQIAANISSGINALGAYGLGYNFATISKAFGTGSAAVSFQFPGTTTLGWAVTIGATASASETVSVKGGAVANAAVVTGGGTITGEALTSLVETSVHGDSSLNSLQSASFLTTDGSTLLVNAQTAQGVTASGAGTGPTCVTMQDVILVGSGNDNTTVDCPSATTSHWANIGNAFMASKSAPVITSGFGTGPSISGGYSSAAFTITIGSGGTANSGLLNMVVGAPHGHICTAVDRTNYTTSNTIAVNSGTPPYVNLYNFSRTTGAAVAWAANDLIDVTCNAY